MARKGKINAYKTGKHENLNKPMINIEIDTTQLDTFVIDPQHGDIIGRPLLNFKIIN